MVESRPRTASYTSIPKAKQLQQNLCAAFPLPQSGSFDDLIQAIDQADRRKQDDPEQ
jgi:hypothetical protein